MGDSVQLEYFREKYDLLVKSEKDSVLLNILTGVGPIETFSDVRTVLKMYDDVAEKKDVSYWIKRSDFLGKFISKYCADFQYTDMAGSLFGKNEKAKRFVECLERGFEGEGEDALKMPFF